MMYDGILNVYKEKGFTSFDVVAKLRGICGQKKIGHTGTLDPDATGVLPVCLGKATKVCDLLTDRDKIYYCEMMLGKETDTYDMTGSVLAENETDHISDDVIMDAVNSFQGDILQVPPMYSALKVNGKRLYELAREGKEVERKARPVTIYSIEIVYLSNPYVGFKVKCSKGTYIRSLCHDIGEKLGCGAAMHSLRRDYAAGYDIEDALTLAEIQKIKDEGKLETIIQPIADVFQDYPGFRVSEAGEKLLMNGNKLSSDLFPDMSDTIPEGPIRVYHYDGAFAAIYQYIDQEHVFRPIKMF